MLKGTVQSRGGLYVRKQPSTDSAYVEVLEYGETRVVSEPNEGWCEVFEADGQRIGYSMASFLNIVAEEPEQPEAPETPEGAETDEQPEGDAERPETSESEEAAEQPENTEAPEGEPEGPEAPEGVETPEDEQPEAPEGVESATEGAEEPAGQEATETPEELMEMTVKELRQVAEKRGIKLGKVIKKEDLLDVLI